MNAIAFMVIGVDATKGQHPASEAAECMTARVNWGATLHPAIAPFIRSTRRSTLGLAFRK
jgi:hypothetical protein